MDKAYGRAMIMVATLAVPFLSTGCSVPIRAGADFQPGYDFGRFTSFVWDEPAERPAGDPRLDESPLFEQRVHAAIQWELSTRGIDLIVDGQDEFEIGGLSRTLAVHHHTSVQDHVEVYEADRDVGVTPDFDEGTRVVQYAEATFIVGLADAGTHELVWSAWARVDVEKALANWTVMRSQIDDAVARMFESFPIPPGQGTARSAR